MLNMPLDDIIKAWSNSDRAGDATRETRKRAEMRARILRLLAEGRPVSASLLASGTGLSHEAIGRVFGQLRAGGAEFDDDGSLVGLALTLNPTPHSFQVEGRGLFAWCSLDTMFLPGLIGQTAHVESTCPVTGTTIRLKVAPHSIEKIDPPTTVLSIVVPGVTPGLGSGPPSGPQCAT